MTTRNDDSTHEDKRWRGPVLLVASLSIASVLLLIGADRIGIGPNLGLHVGYFGRLNRVLDRLESNPNLEVRDVSLHYDTTLEDFYITVRTESDEDVRLIFEGASKRPFDELLLELKKVGM
ncbi:MAG: hypothetical protein AAF196_19120 [Planctomycetota bacterium]